MSQIVDLEGSQKFQSLGVEIVSIATDPISQLQLAARRFSFSSPFLSDTGGKVSRAYGVLRWAHGGEPGHTFVLVDKDGKVKWIRDYGAPENGGLMYVPVEHLYQQVAKYLSVP